MNGTNHNKRASTVLMVVLAVAAAGCGSTGEAAESGLVDPPETTTPTTTVPESTAPTTAVTSLEGDEPVDIDASFEPLTPGTTYLTNTDVPFSFSTVESETGWWPVVSDNWSVSLVFANLVGGDLEGPQLSLAVAEPGATSESVVAAMTASAESLDYQQSEGLFGGRDAIVLDGRLEDPVRARPIRILTGDNSTIEVIFETGRAYRSHVFEEDGRVVIISVEADPDDLPLVLAEAAPIFESLQIGGRE